MALKLKGSTSGFVAIDAPSVAGNNTLILPENTGSAQQLLGNDITAGVVTFTSVTVNRNGDLTVPGTISIGGTLTYEDVTSVDSVGIVTARSGVRINGGGLTIIGDTTGINATGISTFSDISARHISGVAATFSHTHIDIADSIRHIGDTNTKIRFPDANTFTVETAGTERIRVSSAGSFAIGDATEPGARLYVNGVSTNEIITARAADTNGNSIINILSEGTTGNSRINFSDTAGADGQVSYDHTNRRLSFAAGGTSPQAYLDSSGRLLLGTTTEGYGDADNLTIRDSGNCGMTIRSGTSNYGSVFFSDATSGSGEYDGFVQYDHINQKLTFGAGASGAPKLSINSSSNSQFTGIVTATQFVATSVQTSGRKNLIINGGMSIAQRGTAAVTATTTATYKCVDRFKSDIDGSGGGSFSHAQSTDVPTGHGFRHSSVFTTVTQASQPTSESNHHQVYQMLEKQDVYHLEWGTSNAKTCTLSFWVKGSITGTYGLWFSIYTTSNTQYYWTNYTISSANTWEKKTITVTGPTSGGNVTPDSASTGFRVEWVLGVGSDSETGTLNEWTTSSTFRTASGTVYLPENAGATLYLTGVQFEVGSNASAFEFRSAAEELFLCQRYYYRHATGNGKGISENATQYNGSSVFLSIPLPTEMRTEPGLEITNSNNHFLKYANNGPVTFDTLGRDGVTTKRLLCVNGSASGTSGHACMIRTNSADAYIAADAEL